MAWSAKTNDVNQWIQICFLYPRIVTSIQTAGRTGGGLQYVKNYKVQYTMDGINWQHYNNGQILNGNTDINSVITNNVVEFNALAVKINP